MAPGLETLELLNVSYASRHWLLHLSLDCQISQHNCALPYTPTGVWATDAYAPLTSIPIQQELSLTPASTMGL